MENFYACRNYLIRIRYGVISLIVTKMHFKLEKLKGMLRNPLTVFNSKNVEEV
jgi:hypothetical protein